MSWGVHCVFPLLLDCLFSVYGSDSVTLNTIPCDDCCKTFMFAAIVISCDFCWLLWFVLYDNKKYGKIKKKNPTVTLCSHSIYNIYFKFNYYFYGSF